MDMETRQFKIDGMTCAACVRRVEDVIKNVSGVTSASVNLATEKVQVTYEPAGARETAIIHAVESAGYGLAPVDDTRDPGLDEAKKRKNANRNTFDWLFPSVLPSRWCLWPWRKWWGFPFRPSSARDTTPAHLP